VVTTGLRRLRTEEQATTLHQCFVFFGQRYFLRDFMHVRFMVVINAIDRRRPISLRVAATRDYTRNFIGVITTADG